MKTNTPDCRNSRSLPLTSSALITALALALLVPAGSALGADQKKPGNKPISCGKDHCRKVFDGLGQTCTNPDGKPMPGELGPRCECKCLDPGGARKKKV